MRIAILNVDNKRSKSSISDVEPFADPLPWLSGFIANHYFITKEKYKVEIEAILNESYDVILNLCDGAVGENRPGIEVVELLEKVNVPFTGASSSFYEPSRKEMRKACMNRSILTPWSIEIFHLAELNLLSLTYPLIVKHPNSYNSIGLTRKSVVYDFDSLSFQVKKMIREFKGALIEEYIEGKEYTALVVENPDDKNNPVVFTPMEICFPQGETFKHFDLKWKSHNSMKYLPVQDTEIFDRINKMSAEMFKEMNGTGYARCDLRMNAKNELFMLEINPNCSIYFPENDPSSADEILYFERDGHKRFTNLILRSAQNRVSRV